MEYNEIKNKKESDLHKILADTRNALRSLRFKDANKQLKNVREIRENKKLVAQILTILKKKKEEEKIAGA